MKRYEFTQGLQYDYGFTDMQAEQAARRAEQAGVRWDPVEPALPKRIDDAGDLCLLVNNHVRREARARYNLVSRLLAIASAGTERGLLYYEDFRRLLAEERAAP